MTSTTPSECSRRSSVSTLIHPTAERLRQILGAPGLNTMAQLSVPKQPTAPATNVAASLIADQTAGVELKMKQVAAHFVDCGWTVGRGEHGISYSPPLGATDEEIARAKRVAAAIMDR